MAAIATPRPTGLEYEVFIRQKVQSRSQSTHQQRSKPKLFEDKIVSRIQSAKPQSPRYWRLANVVDFK